MAATDGVWDLYDNDEVLALLQNAQSAAETVSLIAGASFVAMHNHIEAVRMLRVIQHELIELTDAERAIATQALQKRVSKTDHLTVTATMLTP